MTKRHRLSVDLFVLFVALSALVALGYDVAALRGRDMLWSRPDLVIVFTVCCLVTELRPLRWLRREEGGEVTASWTFMMALLLVAPPITAVAIATGVVFIGDAVSRKAPVRMLFNAAQIVICLTLGGAALDLVGQGGGLGPHGGPSLAWFPAFLAASALVFAVNNTLTCSVIALHQGLRVAQTLRSVGALNLSTDGVLLSLSPIFVVAAERSLLLVPLLLVTTWTVYRTAELALIRRHEANHDALTMLPNRRLFDEHLHSAVLSAQRTGDRVGVVLIDLNGFKGINDRLGHDIGDQVLRHVAARMNGARRSSDLLARLGGDEFALLLPHVDSVGTASAVADRLRKTFLQPCMIEGFPVLVDASLGVALLPDHAHDSETLLQRADEVMYSAKNSDWGTVGEALPNGPGRGRIGLLADVGEALRADHFFLEYQPQVDLSTGQLVGAEALVRWRHPSAGVLYPLEFIGLAEQTELIGGITEWVLRQALEQCASWRRAGHSLRVAVNISARNMNDVRFPDLVARLFRETGANPGDIELEITENTVGPDRSTTHSVLRRLHGTGVSISIDDFGTGYSSMAQLRDLPVDRIKVDRSFVTTMARQNKDALIVRAMVQLGQALGLETIAEGVEDAAVAELLRALGCTAAQGWLYGKAVPAEMFAAHFSAVPTPRRAVPTVSFERAAS